MPAFVNGCQVPEVIPKEHVLLYFPKGVLGLKKVGYLQSQEAASTPDDTVDGEGQPSTATVETVATEPVAVMIGGDGTLRLEKDGVYSLFSAPHQHQQHEQRPKYDSLGRSALSHSDVHEASYSPRGEREVHRAHSRNDSASGSWFPRLNFFQSVQDISPPDQEHYDPKDIEAKERYDIWHRTRKRQMWHYFSVNVFSLLCLLTALGIDLWLKCECAELGMWKTCAICMRAETNTSQYTLQTPEPTPVPMTLPPNRMAHQLATTITRENETWVETSSQSLKKCVTTDSFSECQSPSFESLQVLLVVVAAAFSFNFVVVCVDLGLHLTPRRPFYAFMFIAIWAMWLAIWVIFGNAETTAVQGNMSQVECSMQQSLQAAIDGDWNGSTLISITDASHTTKSTTYRATVQDCKFHASFWMMVVGWGAWTLFGGAYFYRRYSSWRQWGTTENTLKALVGLGAVTTPEHLPDHSHQQPEHIETVSRQYTSGEFDDIGSRHGSMLGIGAAADPLGEDRGGMELRHQSSDLASMREMDSFNLGREQSSFAMSGGVRRGHQRNFSRDSIVSSISRGIVAAATASRRPSVGRHMRITSDATSRSVTPRMTPVALQYHQPQQQQQRIPRGHQRQRSGGSIAEQVANTLVAVADVGIDVADQLASGRSTPAALLAGPLNAGLQVIANSRFQGPPRPSSEDSIVIHDDEGSPDNIAHVTRYGEPETVFPAADDDDDDDDGPMFDAQSE